MTISNNYLKNLSDRIPITKNWKIVFSFVSEHCAIIWNKYPSWPLLGGGGVVSMLLTSTGQGRR